MNPESETIAALRRAGYRAVYHLLRAGVEGLRAVEAIVDELGSVGAGGDGNGDRVRIEVE